MIHISKRTQIENSIYGFTRLLITYQDKFKPVSCFSITMAWQRISDNGIHYIPWYLSEDINIEYYVL